MQETSFPTEMRILDTDIDGGSPLTPELFSAIRARDQYLFSQMEKSGPPTVIPAQSFVQNLGDLVISQNGTLSGLVYCESLLIEAGVKVTAQPFLVIRCRGDITVHGHLSADGADGVRTWDYSTVPAPGVSAGGGGGGGDAGDGIKGGDGLTVAGGPGGVGQDGHGYAGTGVTTADAARLMLGYDPGLIVGANGGTGGHGGGSYPAYGGGVGGRYIDITCAALTITQSGKISAMGGKGVDCPDQNWGAGGGAGGGMVKVRCSSISGAERVFATGGPGGAALIAGATRGGDGATGVVQIDVYQ